MMRETRSKRLREHDVEESEKGESMLPSVSVRVCKLVTSPAKKIRLESTNAERAKIDIIPVKKIRLDNAPVKRTQLDSVSGEKIATPVDEKTRLHKTSVKLSSNTIDVSLEDSSYDDDDWGKDDNSESDSDEENGNQSKKATDLKSGRKAGNIHVSVNLDKPGNNFPLKHTKHEEDKCAPPYEPSKSGVTPAVRTSTYQPGAEINVAEKEVTTEAIKTGYEEREMPTKINNDDGSTKAATSNIGIVRKLASTNETSLFNKLHPSVNISLARPDDNNSQHGTTTSKQVTVKDAREAQIVPVQLGVEEHSGILEAGWRTPDQKLLPRLGAGISVTRVTPGIGIDIGKGGADKTAREEPIKAQEVVVAVIDLTDNEENEEVIDVEVYLPDVKNESQGMDENDDNKFDHNGLKGEGLAIGLVKSEVKKSAIQRGGLGAAGENGSLRVRKQLVFNDGRGWNARDGGESVPRYPVFNQHSLAGRGNIVPGVRTLQPGVRSPTPRGRPAVGPLGVRLQGRGRVLRGSNTPRYGLAGQSPQFAPPSPSAARQRGRLAAAGWVWQDFSGRVAAQPPRFISPSPARQMSMDRGTVRPAGQGGRLNISNPSVDIRLEIPGDGGSSEVKLVLSKSQVEAIKKLC